MSSGSIPRLTESRIKHYLELAKNACQYSDNKRTKLGSVIVYKNKVLSIGWNMENKTNPLQEEYNKLRNYDINVKFTKSSLHAEFAAMIKIKNMNIDFSRVHLFVCRIKKDGTLGYARPCPACMGFAKSLGIKHIYYSTEHGENSWCYERIGG